MEQEQFDKIIRKHKKWLDSGRKKGKRAIFSGENLAGRSFVGMDLSYATFDSVDLTGCDFSDTNLLHVDFDNAIVSDVDFTRAKLHCARFVGTIALRTNFRQVECDHTTFEGANLTGANFCSASMKHVNLSEAVVYGTNIDFSSWPMWCGGVSVKIDRRLAAQFAYHFCSMICEDEEFIAARKALLPLARRFHRHDVTYLND